MKKVMVLLFAGILSLGSFMQTAAGDLDSLSSKIKVSGFGYYMFGDIVKGEYGDDIGNIFENQWVSTSLIHIGLNSNATTWLTTKLGFEMYADFPLKSANAMDKGSYFRTYTAYLASAEGIMHWDFSNPFVNSLVVESGLFPYTCNSQVKNLGNYMYRSTIHPLSVQTKVDYPWADLLGVRAEAGLFDNTLKFGAFLTSEFIYVPFFDLTPAFSLNYAPNKIIDIGGAIAFHHAMQLDGALLADSVGKKWQGTKIDAKAVIDPKPLFGDLSFLGEDECKIYCEAALLGLRDSLEVDTVELNANGQFPAPSILHHIPMMVGVNVPTCKILDCFTFELEYFGSPYINDWFGLFDNQSQFARPPMLAGDWDNYINKDNFKWSLYLKKVIGKFEARSIIANDHTIYKVVNQQLGNFEQTMKKPKDWQWLVQLRYNL
jgi:hypothetical protein